MLYLSHRMEPIIHRAVETIYLISLFGLLHLCHLISHSIRLSISIVENLSDQLDHFFISCRLKQRHVKEDLKYVKKLPTHLALIWIPINHQLYRFLSLRSWFSFNSTIQRLRYQQQVELDAILENLAKIVSWSMEAGIEEITFYEERGLLKSPELEPKTFEEYLTTNAVFMESNKNIKPRSLRVKPADDAIEITYQLEPNSSLSVSLNSKGSDEPSKTTLMTRSIKVNLIDRHLGHEHIVQVTKALPALAQINCKNKLNFDVLNVKTIGDKICSTSINMPDLLIVLGGRSLRLRGFPPWQLTLTEIYHGSSYGILPYKMRYTEFLKALHLFGKCEQRCGS